MLNFELKAVTPIFMHGADQGRVEIRAASIKGLMKWWFRALAENCLCVSLPRKNRRYIRHV